MNEVVDADYYYDGLADVLFVYIKDNEDYEDAIDLNDNVILSFNSQGVPVAFELLDASKMLNANKFSLKHMQKININIMIDKSQISVNGIFTFQVHSKLKDMKSSSTISNDYDMPIVNIELATA
ncbi:MAG: DUF2283 domain-containing protein [Methanobrevibacter sp.]|jgi:uncharacterized protein YuzE|nr:DUF2283 domain-containing protein [Candidatus Methanovirga procula]